MLNRQLLIEGLGELGLEVTGEQFSRLERYYREIELWNPRYGLVRAAGDELLVKHFLDSLSGLSAIGPIVNEMQSTGVPEVSTGARPGPDAPGTREIALCDVGSGAGFPGVPLAIFLPSVSVTLIENSGRRTSFLRNVVSLLPLPNVSIQERRAEDVAEAGRKRTASNPVTEKSKDRDPERCAFDIVTFRAFRPLEKEILKVLHDLRNESGWIVAYKGRADRIEEELACVRGMFQEVRIVPVGVPFLEEERHLVMLR